MSAALCQGCHRGRLFNRQRDLFTNLICRVHGYDQPVVLTARGGETLGEHGYSKDFRPDLKQMILGLVVDRITGLAHLHRDVAGQYGDVTVPLPVIDRLRQALRHWPRLYRGRPGYDLGRDDRRGLEQRKLDYILGARERSDCTGAEDRARTTKAHSVRS